MRLWVGLSLAIIVLGAGAATVDAARTFRRPCPSGAAGRGPVLFRSARVVVYSRDFETLACFRPTRRRTSLGEAPYEPGGAGSPGHEFGPIRSYGPYLLVRSGYFGGDEHAVTLDLYDVLHGDHVYQYAVDDDPLRELHPADLTGLQLGRAGAIAFVETTPAAPRVQIHVYDLAGARVVAAGPDIDPGSLRLTGDTLTWTAGGAPVSTTLRTSRHVPPPSR